MSIVLLPESAPVPGPVQPTVTLASLEREVGRRVGPFGDLVVEQGLAPAAFQSNALRSTADLGGWENLYALRRGVYGPNGTNGDDPIPGFVEDDRVRLVKTYSPESGTLEVDRDYAVNAVPGERIELHVLHPEWELRPAVLAGLERCFLFDRLPATNGTNGAPNGNGNGTALTTVYPWLTEPSMVWGVEALPADATGIGGVAVGPWEAILSAGGVWLVIPGEYWPTTSVQVLVRRPAWTVVNGQETAPDHVWDDADVLEVALPYAAAAAHVEAWRLARPRLAPLVQTGPTPMWPTKEECAAELTRMTNRWFRPDVRPPEERTPRSATGGGRGAFWNARGDFWGTSALAGPGTVVNR